MQYITLNNCEIELTGPNFDYLLSMGVFHNAQGELNNDSPAARLVSVAIAGNMESDVDLVKPHFSCVFAFHGEDVLLVRKNHPQWQEGRWNGVGGAHRKDESSIECARREFTEEVGDDAPADLREFCVLEDSEVVVHFFVGHFDATASLPALGLGGSGLNDAGEELMWHSTSAEEYCDWQESDEAIENLSWLIPMAKDRFHVQGLVTSMRRDYEGRPVR